MATAETFAVLASVIVYYTYLTAATDEISLDPLLERVLNLEKTNAELQQTVSELNRRVVVLEHEKHNLETQETTKTCKDEVSKTKRLIFSNDGLIAFSATITPRAVPNYSNRQTIVFETIITNIGGAYSKESGVFVAPFKGLYIFSCSVLDDGQSENKLHADIAVNNVTKARIFAFAEHNIHRDQGAQTIFVQLNQGDDVRVRHLDEDNGTVGGDLYTTFSGYLLWPLE